MMFPLLHQRKLGNAGELQEWSTLSKSPELQAEQMRSLEEVTRIAQETADSCRSVGAALTRFCTIPQAGKSNLEIAEDEMEMGMGIHGEPGVWRGKLKPADDIAHEMVDRLIADRAIGSGDRLSVMVRIALVPLLLRNSTSSTELSKSGLKIWEPL